MRGVESEIVHPHGLQRRVHPRPDLRRGHAQILRGEGNVILHHAGHDLVVRVLEHHAHGASDVQQLFLVRGIHALHQHPALRGDQDAVEALCQRALAGAIVAQHRREAAAGDVQRDLPQGGFFRVAVGVTDVFDFDD